MFAQPRVTPSVCEVCKGPVQNGPKGFPWPKCQACHLKTTRKPGKVSDIKKFSEIQIHDIDNSIIRTQAELVGATSIYEFAEGRNYDHKRYRMSVKVTDMHKNRPIKALLDTGCNTEVLSLQACTKLGISHKINRNVRSSARGVDNRDLGVIGEVNTTLHVGDIPYTQTFQVLKNISGYDMMIGTRFMLSNDLMSTIYGAAQETLGKNNVSRGN